MSTSPEVSVLVPLSRDLHGWRKRAWYYVSGWWLDNFPRVQVVPGHPPDDDWNKGAAVADALTRADHDRLVVADADVFTRDPAAVTQAVRMLDDYAWAVPHELVERLSERSTLRTYVSGTPPLQPTLARLAYRGMLGGGMVCLRRAAYEAAPIDERFVGWGDEDQAFGFAQQCLHGPPWRGGAALVHLWHQHPMPRARHSPHAASRQLLQQYRRARSVPRLMRGVIAGERPADKVPAAQPVAFKVQHARRYLRVADQVCSVEHGVLITADPDVIEVLRQRATPEV